MNKHALSILAILALSTVNLDVKAETGNRARKMLTPEIAQSILGAPVQESSRNAVADTVMGNTWVSTAAYMLGDNSTSQVSVLIRHGSKEESKNAFVQCKEMYKGIEVKGIGDAAYRTTSPAQLCVLKGNNWLIFMCGTFKNPDAAGQEKAAKAVLSKLTD